MRVAARAAEIIVEAAGMAAIGPLLRAVHRASPNMTLKVAHGGSTPAAQNQFMKHSLARNARIILDMIERGELHVEPLLARTIKPEEAPQAYRDLRDHPESTLAITMEWA